MKGAHVHVVYLDPSPTGAKVGLDDHFAAGGTVTELLARAEDNLRPLLREEPEAAAGPYLATPAGFVQRKGTPDAPNDLPLSNFTATIVEEVMATDGASERTELSIEGNLGDETLPRLHVPTRRFRSLDWVSEWGARPIIAAGFGNQDRVREAIQRLSPDIERRRVYEHPGWRNLPEHGWVYLHAGGAIGAAGTIADVNVALRGPASRLVLPDPPSGDELRTAVHSCLALLDLAPDRITVPLFGAVYRALLCELLPADLAVFLVGPTGVFKTELAALAQQHVGASFDRLHLPAQWSSTANGLERVAFDFKDTVLVIDDFAPHGTPADVARLHATADRVIRGAGNRGGRSRMQADGTLRPDLPPRGIMIGTGEDAPRGQSLRARMMLLDVGPGDVDRERLTAAQEDGRAGVFAAGLAGFTQWLAPQFDELGARLPELLADLRTLAHDDAAHARTPEAVAHLALGWRPFLRFAAEVEALSRPEVEVLFDRVWAALGETAARQSSYQAGEEPARRFLDLLSSALAAGHVHVAATDGRVPPFHPGAWGWREGRIGFGENERTEWRAEGSRAGWIDGEDLYLDLEAALAGIQRVSQATGNGITVTPKTLAKRLNQQKFLRSTDEQRGHLQVRRVLEGSRRNVLHLAESSINLQESAQSAIPALTDTKPTQRRGLAASDGPIVGVDPVALGQDSAHVVGPQTASSRSDGAIGSIGPIVQARPAAIERDATHPSAPLPQDIPGQPPMTPTGDVAPPRELVVPWET